MSNNLLDRVATPVLIICCVAITTLSLKQYFFPPAPPTPQIPVQATKGRPLPDSARIGLGNLRIGPKDAPLQITEFADFECPFCSVAARQMHELQAKYPATITITFRHFLIGGHAHAPLAAAAAECAADQGAFEKYHSLLFENYRQLTQKKIRALAKTAGVTNMGAFDDCVASNRHEDRIHADTVAGRMAGVGGTPSWVVGDSIYGGLLATSQVEGWAKALMSKRTTTAFAR